MIEGLGGIPGAIVMGSKAIQGGSNVISGIKRVSTGLKRYNVKKNTPSHFRKKVDNINPAPATPTKPTIK